MNALGRWILGAVFAASLLQGANAQSPRQTRMIVPFAAGGVVDIVARAFAQELSGPSAAPVIVDNRVGANGNIGMEACAKSAPDGTTLCVVTGVIVSLNPFAYASMPFDAEKDFVPVIHLGTLNITVAVHPSVPANNMRELIELSKAKPGTVTWSSLGPGSTAHLYMEWLHARAGAAFNHIPYKGQPPMVLAAVSGEVNVTMLPPGAVAPLAKAGKLRVISMMSGAKRIASMPEVPTFIEQGYNLDFRNWIGVVLPRGATAELVRRVHGDFARILADPRFVEKNLVLQGVAPVGGTSEEFAAFLKADRAVAGELAKIAKLKLD
jgi:tripartite-type tricarboxylate transporter receptor subunit TctC